MSIIETESCPKSNFKEQLVLLCTIYWGKKKSLDTSVERSEFKMYSFVLIAACGCCSLFCSDFAGALSWDYET